MPELLPMSAVCEILHCVPSSVYRYIAKGILPRPIKRGGSSLWIKAEIEAALARMVEARHG
jgi:predicted DNA-binding transcriptional regulator AlpA